MKRKNKPNSIIKNPNKNSESKENPSKENLDSSTTKTPQNLPMFKSMMRIRIVGFNQARIINALNSEFITLLQINRLSPKILELTIHKKDSAKTFAILEKMCYNYIVLGKSGAGVLMSAALKHIGLAAGALIFMLLIALSTQVVWRIEVSGNTSTDTQLIIRELKTCGVKLGAFKSGVDRSAITSRLRSMDGIAEGTVELVGTTIKIKVIEEKKYIPPNGDNEFFSDITSGFDAQITRIDVKKGAANFSVGDKVKADDVLIRGERLNSLGEPLEKLRAEGSVYGIVTFKEKHIFSSTEQILTRTGKQKTITNLSIFGLNIGKKKQPDWEKETDEFKLFFIPIKVRRTDCYETKIVERERDISAYVESLKDEAIIKNVIKAGGSEINTVTTLTPMDGGLYMLNIYIQAEILISQA